MPITRPTGDQLRFQSSQTGEHVLDDYMEAVERGDRTLADLIDDLWNADTGNLRTDLWRLRLNPLNFQLEQRIGDYSDPDEGWEPVTNASIFNIRGEHEASTAYLRLDIVRYNDTFYLCTMPHISSTATPNGSFFSPLIDLQDTGVASFNGRFGSVLLTSGDIGTALGYTPVSPTGLTAATSSLAPLASPVFTGTPSLPPRSLLRKQNTNLEGGELVFEKADAGATGGNVVLDLLDTTFRIFDDNAGSPDRRFTFNLASGNIYNSTRNANVSFEGHTHPISAITNLQTTLDGKASTVHTHPYLPLTGGSLTGDVTITKSSPAFDLNGENPVFRLRGGPSTTFPSMEFWGNVSAASTRFGRIRGAAPNRMRYEVDQHEFYRADGTTSLATLNSTTFTVLGRNPLAELDGKAAIAHTHAIGDVTGLQTALDGKLSTTGGTLTGATQVNNGTNQVLLSADGAIEIARGAGVPYIDFKDTGAEDYDVRLRAVGDVFEVLAPGGINLGNNPITIYTHAIGQWTSSVSDISGLISGSTSGALYEGPPSAHFTVGIRSNDISDGFQIISKQASGPDGDYTLRCFEVKANGAGFLEGSLTTRGLRVERPDADTQYVELANSITGNIYTSHSPPTNAKFAYFNATTDTSNTTPSAGGCGMIFSVLGDEKLRIEPTSINMRVDNVRIIDDGPTMWWQDTNQRAFAIHVNNDIAYFMRGGVNSPSWTGQEINGRWPLTMSLSTGNLVSAADIEGSNVVARSRVGAGVSSPAYAVDANSGTSDIVARFQSGDVNAFIDIRDSSTSPSAVRFGAVGNEAVIWANSAQRFRINTSGNSTFSGSVSAPSFFGDGNELGYRRLELTNVLSSPTTATRAIHGKGYYASQTLTVPANVFVGGDMFTVIAANPSSISIVQGSGLTLRLAGTTSTGNRSLATNGIATIIFVSATQALISGPGVS